MIKNHVENYGTICDKIFYKNYILIVCNNNDIYSLLLHNRTTENTQSMLRCGDIQYIEYKIKDFLKNN